VVPNDADRAVTGSVPVALVHDYLTQRGGAERVVLSLAEAYPEAPLHTSLYDRSGTFPDFGGMDIHTLPINHIGPLRARHRLALPVLAPSFSRLTVDAEVAICSSSGWAHGAHVTGRKIVYCHTPARWLYQTERYLEGSSPWSSALLSALAPSLRRWDRRAADSAQRYLVNSTAVGERVAELYGIEAELVPPPVEVDPDGPVTELADLAPGFFLCVSRLLPYKNVGVVTEAFALLPEHRLVVVGSGPQADAIRAGAPGNVSLLGTVDDATLRWLYRSCAGLVTASHEDFGLTPIEAAAFGKPTAALRWGGFLDTMVEGTTGVFIDRPEQELIAAAVEALEETRWSAEALRAHARQYSVDAFTDRIAEVVAAERAAG
jgi:glycosyltransferase involved in cell wall biosynthesis